MCGIVGYIGKRRVDSILLNGLERLEYRGYDSAGIALVNNGKIKCVKAAGQVSELRSKVDDLSLKGKAGIAHTRWATHGAPNEKNAHPHMGDEGSVAVVHNGIVENYSSLKDGLEREGCKFESDTDTEVLAHLIGSNYDGDLLAAVERSLKEVEGTYGLAVVHKDHQDEIVVARKGSPLIIGLSDGEALVASDAAAVVECTERIVYLEEGEVGRLTASDFRTAKKEARPVADRVERLDFENGDLEKKDYPHYMLKEIFEQPTSIRDTLRGRLDVLKGEVVLGGLKDYESELTGIKR